MPVPETEPQDLTPWVQAVETLLDADRWREESARSLAAGLGFVRKLGAGQFEQYLLGLQSPVANKLTAGQRAMLIEKLRRRPTRLA